MEVDTQRLQTLGSYLISVSQQHSKLPFLVNMIGNLLQGFKKTSTFMEKNVEVYAIFIEEAKKLKQNYDEMRVL